MLYIFYIFIFLFGLTCGSFLNAVIYRLAMAHNYSEITRKNAEKRKLSIIFGRSICPHCGQSLAWYDLIPVLSFLLLFGKCRYCQEKISWQYPAVEIATALLFLLIFNQFFLINRDFGGQAIIQFLNLLYLFYVASALIIVFVYDLKHYLIPDKIILPAIIVSLVWNSVFVVWDLFGIFDLGFRILISFGAAGFFYLLILLSRGRWMGFGDVKLVFFLGLILSWPKIFVAIFIAFVLGAIIGIGLIFFGKKTLKSQLPFGPFLVFGAFTALFWGNQIIKYYFRFLGF